MTEILIPALRIAGGGLLLLAVLHLPISRRLRWNEESARMSLLNASVFRVHNLFICLVLVATGLPCLFDPHVLIEPSRAAAWGAWSLCAFWSMRLWCQWLVYPASLWRGKRLETALHAWCSVVWAFLAVLFGVCGARQVGWVT
jgi:hypothetical protein